MKLKSRNVIAIVLCGGVGSRLWPLSHKNYPKPFISINGVNSLFQETLLRITLVASINDICIVGSARNEYLIADQIQGVNLLSKFKLNPSVLLESETRNTAGSLTLACLNKNSNEDEVIVVLPADHEILNINKFTDYLEKGIEKVIDENIILIMGIKPTEPEVGYGYAKVSNIKKSESYSTYDVISFHEKPTINVAKKYYESGDYLWNSGIFIMRKKMWIDSIKKYSNGIYSSAHEAFSKSQNKSKITYVNTKNIESNSIDYAVIEKIAIEEQEKIKMMHIEGVSWNDLGTWESVKKSLQTDGRDQSVFIGEVIHRDTKNVLIKTNRTPVVALGIKDLIVINTAGGTLIASNEYAKDLKKIVEDGNLPDISEQIYIRPWGQYRNIERKDNYLIKKIYIRKEESISLQKHTHRSECWVVIKGRGYVEVDEKKIILEEGDQIKIEKKSIHRVTNIGETDLVIIEIQIGSIISEEDIVRYSDKYGRN